MSNTLEPSELAVLTACKSDISKASTNGVPAEIAAGTMHKVRRTLEVLNGKASLRLPSSATRNAAEQAAEQLQKLYDELRAQHPTFLFAMIAEYKKIDKE